ncbi:MAG TPA: ATP-binding protein [Jatrophihabitans sp.]|nr:ATP-binding protein [Jatrophihabitans sp.]
MGDAVLIELPAEPSAVAIARAFVTEHAGTLDPVLRQDAELLVSELVSNAVLHGQPSISLRVRTDPPGIGIEVHDEGPGMPALPSEEPSADRSSGRGLRMVAALASAWGIQSADGGPGKIVWFTLAPAS